jgi:hypothetical protein
VKKLTMAMLLSCSTFWNSAYAEPTIDCGGREAIDLVIELAAKHDYGMMTHNAASKYFETHPTQEFINAKNYLDKADAAYNAAQQVAGDANRRWTAMFDRRAQESASAALARNSPPLGSPEEAARLDVTVAYTVKETAYAEYLRAKTASDEALQNGIATCQARAKPPLTYTVETIRTLAKDETGRDYCQATLRGSAGEFGEWTALIIYTVETTSDHRLYITIQQ